MSDPDRVVYRIYKLEPKRLDENIRILQLFKINEWYLVRKLNLKFMWISMILYQIYTNSFTLIISFVFPSWIINEFHEYISEYNSYKSLWKT